MQREQEPSHQKDESKRSWKLDEAAEVLDSRGMPSEDPALGRGVRLPVGSAENPGHLDLFEERGVAHYLAGELRLGVANVTTVGPFQGALRIEAASGKSRTVLFVQPDGSVMLHRSLQSSQ